MVQRARTHAESAVRSHLYALEVSSRLTTYFREHHQPAAVPVTPENVLEVLNAAEIVPVLLGTHGLGGWRDQPRATQDVDVLVREKDIRKAMRVIHAEYPKLTVADLPMMTRFVDPVNELPAIDLLRPPPEVCELLFCHTIPIGKTHLIPDLEMAIAAKFAAMLSPICDMAKRYLHAGDLYNVIGHNRGAINASKLRRLAANVVRGGGAKIARLVENIDAEEMIQL